MPNIIMTLGGLVVYWLGHWICNSMVASLIAGCHAVQ